jgi:hypothetical protein
MSVFKVGGRAEEYIIADHLPPHNYGERPWGVGFEMSPGQNDIMRGLFGRHHTSSHLADTDWG